MKIVIDMNLSPAWVGVFVAEGWEAVHWSSIGQARAPDAQIMSWARTNGCVVFTHDLDFSALLAATGLTGPSVIQIRTQDVLPDRIGPHAIAVIREYEEQLNSGAIVVVEPARGRVRMLPLREDTDAE